MKGISGKSEVCSARRRLQSAGVVGSFILKKTKATYHEFVLNSCRSSEGRHGKRTQTVVEYLRLPNLAEGARAH